MQRVAVVNRSGATFDVVNIRAFIGDDQGALELTHVLGVDSKVCLKRNLYVHTLWHVDEASARPNRGVQRSKLVVAGWNYCAEVLFENLWVLF